MKKFTFEVDPRNPRNTLVTVHVNKYEKWYGSFLSPISQEQARHTWKNNSEAWTAQRP